MNYAQIKKRDIANGVGVRVSLFVSGCKHHCKGCFNQVAWDFNYGFLFDNEVKNKIFSYLEPDYIDGITILGGEPFEEVNQRVLLPFLKELKIKYPNKSVWVYTGFIFDQELLENSRGKIDITEELLSYIDILVDGRFIEELKDISLNFRGSKNQRIIDVKESIKEKKVILSSYN